MSPRDTTSQQPVENTTQAAAWNGPEGASCARRSATRVPNADLVEVVLDAAAIGSGERVLDIGCGTGELTRRAARLAPGGEAIGIDLSTLMVEQARALAAEGAIDNVSFQVGDAQVHPFPAGAFDVALSHFGIMFFDDPVAAFTNVAEAIRPGGRMAFVCPQAMDRCDWYLVPLAALLGHRPSERDAPSAMFSLAEPSTLRATLTAAGLGSIDVQPVDRALWFGTDAAAAAEGYLGSGPVRGILERHPALGPEDTRRALEEAVAPYLGADGIRIPGSHWLVTATQARDLG